MSEELKPCPCGGPLYTGEYRFDVETQWCVGCMDCDRNSGKHADKPSAIAAWNRRASPTPEGEEMGKLLERAREIAADDVSAMTASWVDTQAFARALLSSPRVERARALEEAAKVAEELAGNLKHLGSTIHPLVQIGSHLETCRTIATAIRALSLQVEGTKP